METLAFRPGRKCRSLQWLLGKDKIATCRVSQLCGGILSRYGFKAAHLKLVRATASRLQTGMVRRVSGHTQSTVRGIERRIRESQSFMAWEDAKNSPQRSRTDCSPGRDEAAIRAAKGSQLFSIFLHTQARKQRLFYGTPPYRSGHEQMVMPRATNHSRTARPGGRRTCQSRHRSDRQSAQHIRHDAARARLVAQVGC
jgi:hypothetical protein